MDHRRQKTDCRTRFSTAHCPSTCSVQPVSCINKLISFILIGLRPLLGPATCRYEISCGNYALTQLQQKPLLPAVFAIVKRIVRCNPFLT